MRHGFLLGAVEAGAFQHDVYAKLTPRQISCLRACIDGDFFAVYRDGTGNYNGLAVLAEYGILVGNGVTLCHIATLCGIVFEQVCKHLRAGQVVDCDNLIAFCTEHLTECQTTDTTETIDSNFY